MKKEPMTLEKLGVTVGKLAERLDVFAEKVDQRFEQVASEIRGLGVLMESMDDKFTLLSEGQEIIHEVLETRVSHIEEILEVKVG